ncbi:MAG: hypothetical protein K8S62_06040 [Candidatus Sabulitectum sp.]|nr:hypothetical protein [Candidatus Sabulitectum sp.]
MNDKQNRPGERIPLSRIVDIIQRLRDGESQASVSRNAGTTTDTVRKYSLMARASGWLSPENPCPGAAEIEEKIEQIDSARIAKYETPILLQHKDIIMHWLIAGHNSVSIRQLLIEERDLTVSFETVQKFCIYMRDNPVELKEYYEKREKSDCSPVNPEDMTSC